MVAAPFGGEKSAFEKITPVLEPIGKNIFHLGDVGCGNIAKLANNMIAATCNAITAECFVMGVKAGIDPQTPRQLLLSSSSSRSRQDCRESLRARYTSAH